MQLGYANRYKFGSAECYDMIAKVSLALPKAIHNKAEPFISHNSPKAIITNFRFAKIIPTQGLWA